MSLQTPAIPPDLLDLVASSRVLLVHHQAPSGAFPAAPSYPVYGYCWFRDGAFIADGLSRHGDTQAADAFHAWCSRIITDRADLIEDLVSRLSAGGRVEREEFLPTRYTLDGSDGPEDWENFQTDGYGSWLWALEQHLGRHGGDVTPYRRAANLTAQYLSQVWSQPCYDWWEEHPQHNHVSTLGAIVAGLDAVLRLQVLDPEIATDAQTAARDIRETIRCDGLHEGHAVKWLGSTAVDGSLFACVAPFQIFDYAVSQATVSAVERDLVADGGVYRYRDDTFYGGGRWPVLTAFHGLALASSGRSAAALDALGWIASTATAEGYLPEQVGPRLHGARKAEWVERWGAIATPLLWSHGMFLILADELGIHA